MLIVISPAKTLDYSSPLTTELSSMPDFIDDSAELVERMRELSPPEIERLMGISKKLADLNFGRFLNWNRQISHDNARQAVLAFKGDVYVGLEAGRFSDDELHYAQAHLRILSGLYGVLKPLDLMQPYRLEMGTRITTNRGGNLYEFWGDKPTQALNNQLRTLKSHTLLNLASREYFKVINPERLDAEVVTPVFKDRRKGTYKIISFFAKKARGLMSAWVIQNRIQNTTDLKKFALDGYRYCDASSQVNELVFLRDAG